MVPSHDPDLMTESEAPLESDPEMDLFFDSLVWEDVEEEQVRRPQYSRDRV